MNFIRQTQGISCLLVSLAFLSAAALSQTSGATPGANPCAMQLVPGLNRLSVPPVGRIRVMPTRYDELNNALIGYEKTHVPLVSYDGRGFGPSGVGDDLGAYYFIPQLAVRLRLPLRRSIDLFYVAVLIIAVAIGVFGCHKTLRTGIGKTWAITQLLLVTALAYSLGDVYIVLYAVVVAIVPLALWVINTSSLAIAAPFMFASGVAISTANTIRGHSGTGVLLFLLCLIPFRFIGSNRRKIAILLLLGCGLLVPRLYLSHIVTQRETLLRSSCFDRPNVLTTHPFWHQVYIGFGYLTNDTVANYNDKVAYDKVQSIVPGTVYQSAEYEGILRQQVWLLVREHPKLVAYTIAAKLGVICSLCLLFANVGLIGAKFAPKPVAVEVAFCLGLCFSALFGIVAVPVLTYLLGLIAFATLYGAVSLDFALQRKKDRETRDI